MKQYITEPRDGNTINMSPICNQECIFCSGYIKKRFDSEQIKRQIRSLSGEVRFQGGEPTLNPELADFIAYAKRIGIEKITLITNGLKLSDRNYLKSLIDAGLNEIVFSFPAATEKLNDFLSSCKGSFRNKMHALKNVYGCGLGKNTRIVFVINKLNYTEIPSFVEMINSHFGSEMSIEFKLIQLLGNPERNRNLMPPLLSLVPHISKALDYAAMKKMRVVTNGIPACYLWEYFENSIEYEMRRENKKDLKGREYIKRCEGCEKKKFCMGYRSDYLPLFPEEPKPIIRINTVCNNNCLFCHLHERGASLPIKEIITKVEMAHRMGYRFILFSGGEPLLHKDFLRLANYLKRIKLPFGLVTNMRMLSNKKLLNFLVSCGLKKVYGSLHSNNKETQNSITRSESFEQSVAAIKNLVDSNVELVVNLVLIRSNYQTLREFVDFMAKLGVKDIKFSYAIPEGNSLRFKDETLLGLKEVFDKVKEAIDYAHLKHQYLNIYIDYFPNCVIRGYEHLMKNLLHNSIYHISNLEDHGLEPADSGSARNLEICSLCEDDNCPGFYEEYVKRFGFGEFEPIFKLKPNSVRFVRRAIIPLSIKKTECPFKNSSNSLPIKDCNREVLLYQEGSIQKYTTNTRDFTDEQIREIKERGQIYFNVKGSPVSNFAEEYSKVSLAKFCSSCDIRDNCCGLYLFEDDNIFTKAEKDVLKVLETLKGDVLDVGCGDILHPKLMTNLVKSGRIKYLGIDPDKEKALHMNAEFPQLDVRIGDISAINLPANSLDYILCLRSINHFEKVIKSIDNIKRMLKPKGKLLIVDNSIFIELNHKPLSVGGNNTWEHFNNFSLDEVRDILSMLSFKVLLKKDINKNTANQWMILCENLK